jgi:hypothetical protein
MKLSQIVYRDPEDNDNDPEENPNLPTFDFDDTILKGDKDFPEIK